MKKTLGIILSILFLLISCSKKDGQFYYDQAVNLTNESKYEKAMVYAQKAESMFSKEEFQWKELIVLQGEIYLWQNDTEAAVKEFTRALDNFPEDDEVLLNIVVTCVRCEKIKVAKEFCEQGILSKKYGDITNGLFYYYLAELSTGNFEKCRDLIMQAKICFLKAGTNQYDQKVEDFIERNLSSDPHYWTLELQREKYRKFFDENNLDEALNFRKFIEALSENNNHPVYEYNPLFLCYESYPQLIDFFYEKRPDLFLKGNYDLGLGRRECPFLYVVKNKSLEDVKFYFDNNIPVFSLSEDEFYGDRNAGGPRFGLGGNVLLYTKPGKIRDYLILQGVPAELEPDTSFMLYGFTKDIEIYKNPGFDREVIGVLPKMESGIYHEERTDFQVVSVLAYKVDDSGWIKITYNGIKGWIPSNSFEYSDGI